MTVLVCQVANSENLAPVRMWFVLLEEMCSASKNNETNSELDRLRIWCHDTFKLQGGVAYCSEISDNPPGIQWRTSKEKLDDSLSTLLARHNQSVWLTICFSMAQTFLKYENHQKRKKIWTVTKTILNLNIKCIFLYMWTHLSFVHLHVFPECVKTYY